MAAADLDPKNDFLFKRLFGHEENVWLLIDLLNAHLDLPPGQPIRQVEITNPLVLKAHTRGKGPAMDVRARDELGRQFHLEMQQVVPFSFGKRAVYYWAVAHAGQMLEGDYYETLCPTYTICFVNQPMFPGEEMHHVFELRDRGSGRRLCEDIQVHIVELSKFSLRAEEVQTARQRWWYFLRHGASLDPERLPAALDTPLMRQAMEVIMAVSREEAERWLAHDIQVGIRDRATFREEARRAKEELDQFKQQAQKEADRRKQEADLLKQEADRIQQEAEKARVAAEKAQQQAEKDKQLAEKAQQQAEKDKQLAEKAQQDAEKARDDAAKGPLVGQIQLCQQGLQLPLTPAEALLRHNLAELQRQADDLKQQLFPRRHEAP